MNDIDTSSDDVVFTLLYGALCFIVLIVFFIQASRVGEIKNILEQRSVGSAQQPGYAEHYERGELSQYLGNTQEAILHYRSALFFIEKIKAPTETDQRNRVQIEKKIAELS